MVELAHQPTDIATLDISTDVDVWEATLDLTVGGAGEAGGGGQGSGGGEGEGSGDEV